MLRTFFSFFALLLTFSANSQNYSITWGDDIKLKKATTDLEVVSADNTGVYLTEKRMVLKSYFLIGATYGDSHRLMKLDKTFSEVFEKDYKKELKGLDFHSFQMLGNDLYLFATDYSKKDLLFKVYGAKIDKNTGDLADDFLEIGSYSLESKRDDYNIKITPIRNGSSFLLVSDISGSDRVSLGISILDKAFHIKQTTLVNLAFDPHQYELHDVRYTNTDKIVVLGKEFEETTYGKKKKKHLVFKEFTLSVYNTRGKKERDIPVDANDRYIISGKLIQELSGTLLLAGFYSNAAKKEDLSGFFINKLGPDKGSMLLSSYKEINTGMLGKSYDDASDDDDDSKQSKKEAQKAKDDDDEDDFPNNFTIRSVDINPGDNSIIITSEVSQYQTYSYTTSTYNSATHSYSYSTTYVHRFTNRDILLINADKDGNIKWLNDLPKSQEEEIRTSSSGGSGISFGYDYGGYFAGAGGMPYYSSYISIPRNNELILIMNDHTSNNVNANYGDKVKTVYNFKKRSNVYGISIDLASGKMTRKTIATNSDETILMPRHGYIIGSEVLIPSWRQHSLAKTELRFARITIK